MLTWSQTQLWPAPATSPPRFRDGDGVLRVQLRDRDREEVRLLEPRGRVEVRGVQVRVLPVQHLVDGVREVVPEAGDTGIFLPGTLIFRIPVYR